MVRHVAARLDPAIFARTDGRLTLTVRPTLPMLTLTVPGRARALPAASSSPTCSSGVTGPRTTRARHTSSSAARWAGPDPDWVLNLAPRGERGSGCPAGRGRHGDRADAGTRRSGSAGPGDGDPPAADVQAADDALHPRHRLVPDRVRSNGGGPRPRLPARPGHPGRRHPGLGHRDPRWERRQRRPAHHRGRARGLAGPAPVGAQRLHARPGLPRPRGRLAGRPAGTAAGLSTSA